MDDERWDHLKQLPWPEYRDARPQLLIGLGNLRLAVPLKTREGLAGELVAVKTRLGWCVYGKTTGSQIGKVLHMSECGTSDKNSTIQGALRKFYELEQLGTVSSDVPNPDERRALTIPETRTVRIGNRFKSDLLWKTDNVELPWSLGMARRRLECLERRMERDPKLRTVVHHHIADMMEKGYIHKGTSAELYNSNSKRIWYLPLGVVTNPKKPGKVRIIWDAVAKVQGEPYCTMLCGKAKVAPLQPLTIPKMELQACLLGARHLKSTEQHHPIPVKRRVLWTDSTVALSWIHADPRNHRPFVANRAAEIQENTNMDNQQSMFSSY
uniref:Uncharacterized protein n=1 Tax=Anopheles arabiensis TaxID=7173 RepID=A0A182HYC9_ANOAR